MNYSEIKEAFQTRKPVLYSGIEYKHINAIIFRKSKGQDVIQVELQDRQVNSVTIATIDKVEEVGR